MKLRRSICCWFLIFPNLVYASDVSVDFKVVKLEAESTKSSTALLGVARRFLTSASSLHSKSKPKDLSLAAEALGALTNRSRDLKMSSEIFSVLRESGDAISEALQIKRDHFEMTAGEDEDKLLSLYNSEDWRRLAFAEIILTYWDGWILVSLAENSPKGEDPQSLMRGAVDAFSRTSLEIALPQVVTMSLLGLGISRRFLGDLTGAKQALDQLEIRLGKNVDQGLRSAFLLERAMLALKRGEVIKAERLLADIPDGVLDDDQIYNLTRLKAESWLLRAKKGEEEAAASAAEALRTLDKAGGSHALNSARLVMENSEILQNHDVGRFGNLLDGERAFSEERFADAQEAYLRVLSNPIQLPGFEIELVRYRFAVSVSRAGGDRVRALDELQLIIEGKVDAELRVAAVRLGFYLALNQNEEYPTDLAEKNLVDAARQLLQLDPSAPTADRARFVLARLSADRRETVRLLEAIPPESTAYSSALAELVHHQAQLLQAGEAKGRSPDRSMAKKLLRDLDRLKMIVDEAGSVDDLETHGRYALLRARASDWAGESAVRVLSRIKEAENYESGETGRRVLMRLKLRSHIRSGNYSEVADRLDLVSISDLSRDYSIWAEAVKEIEGATEFSNWILVSEIHEKLVEAAPARLRSGARLNLATSLLRAGSAREAADIALSLIEIDQNWGDPRVIYARALSELDNPQVAAKAWRFVVSSVPEKTSLWLEGQVALMEESSDAGDLEASCSAIAEIRASKRQLNSNIRLRMSSLAESCGMNTE